MRPSAGISMDFPTIGTSSPFAPASAEDVSFDEMKAERYAKLDRVADPGHVHRNLAVDDRAESGRRSQRRSWPRRASR